MSSARHGGDVTALARRAGRRPADLLDFSANINPLGTPPLVRPALLAALDCLGHYPDPACTGLTAAIAEHLRIDPGRIIPGNGAEQLIWWLPRLLDARRVLVTAPSYLDYRRSAAVWRLPVVAVELRAADGFALDLDALARRVAPGDLVWIGHPNNPTGVPADLAGLERAARAHPQTWWALDEAFIDFVADGASAVALGPPNLIVLRSMTKLFALPGLRLGYAVLAPGLARSFRGLLPEWSVNTPAQAAGIAVLRDPGLPGFIAATRRLIGQESPRLAAGLRALGMEVWDGRANYLLVRLPEPLPQAATLASRLLLEQGIAVRVCDNYQGLDERFLRVAVRRPDENGRLLAGLAAVL